MIGLAATLTACGSSSSSSDGDGDGGGDTTVEPIGTGAGDIGLGVADMTAATNGTDSGAPGDMYFSVAITENSHNHIGEYLLWLDWDGDNQGTDPANRVVSGKDVSASTMSLDGNIDDWVSAGVTFTEVRGHVQNNYPLSEFVDSTASNFVLGAAYDDDNVYFVVQWVDAGHDASTARNEWTYDGTDWAMKTHTGVTTGAPNADAVNASHTLAGAESEDRVFLMWPIIDSEGNFADGGIGCADYCHANIVSADDATQNYTGESPEMATPDGDKADLWHWKSSRSAPAGYSDDNYIDSTGRHGDTGTNHYSELTGDALYDYDVDNCVKDDDGKCTSTGGPTHMGASGAMTPRSWLWENVAETLDTSGFSSGDTLPFVMVRAATGDHSDLQTYATFNSTSNVWTLEYRRVRNTASDDDYQFLSATADKTAPTSATGDAPSLPTAADVTAGLTLYTDNCNSCHGAAGVGVASGSTWTFPRIQRASIGSIRHAIAGVAMMSGNAAIAALTEAEVSQVAAYLQTQATAP